MKLKHPDPAMNEPILTRVQELREAMAKDPEALAEFEELCSAMLKHDPSATVFDLLVEIITPKTLFEQLLKDTHECRDCLRAIFEGRARTCELHATSQSPSS
jgi:hypothetical protein